MLVVVQVVLWGSFGYPSISGWLDVQYWGTLLSPSLLAKWFGSVLWIQESDWHLWLDVRGFEIRNVCSTPLSSIHLQAGVPVMTSWVREHPRPFMILSLTWRGPSRIFYERRICIQGTFFYTYRPQVSFILNHSLNCICLLCLHFYHHYANYFGLRSFLSGPILFLQRLSLLREPSILLFLVLGHALW